MSEKYCLKSSGGVVPHRAQGHREGDGSRPVVVLDPSWDKFSRADIPQTLRNIAHRYQQGSVHKDLLLDIASEWEEQLRREPPKPVEPAAFGSLITAKGRGDVRKGHWLRVASDDTWQNELAWKSTDGRVRRWDDLNEITIERSGL